MIIRSRKKLYRNTIDGKVMGVCAGIADYLEVAPIIIRGFLVLGVMMTGFWPGVFLYFFLGFILKPKPYSSCSYKDDVGGTSYGGYGHNRESYGPAPEVNEEAMRQRFQDIERRTREMEAEITSKRFRLEREIEKLSLD